MIKKTAESIILRIALLQERTDRDNGAIIRKLKRKLRKMGIEQSNF